VELWQLLLIVGTLLATLASFVWVAIRLSTVSQSPAKPRNVAGEAIQDSVNQAFTEDFREELRQRARQQFEKIIHENAMFLQQDVRVSAAQLDDFMKKEVIATLQQELGKHHQAIEQTKQMVTDALTKNQSELQRELEAEKERRIKHLDEHMAEIVKTYVMAAVGETIDVDKQLALVVDNLNAHKAEIIEDIRRDG
jgi:Skp family chaperone for outer membrane proteins